MFNGKIHYKWSFSIAMLIHQRVGEFNWDMSWDVTDVTNQLDMIMRDQLIGMDSKNFKD